MEVTQVYNYLFGEVATEIKNEYGKCIKSLTFDIQYVAPFLDEFQCDLKAYHCTSLNSSMEFFFIYNSKTLKLEELSMIGYDTRLTA